MARRRNSTTAKLTPREKKALAFTGTFAASLAAIGTAIVWRRRAPARVPNPPFPDPAAGRSGPEPVEGYVARWYARREQATRNCRLDEEVGTWAQALACALNQAYPEAAPWTDTDVRTPWMEAAADLVENDLLAVAGQGDPSPPVWRVLLWLRGDREILSCRAEFGFRSGNAGNTNLLAPCVAGAIFPAERWPPVGPAANGWQQQFYDAVRQRISEKVAAA